MRIGRTWNRRGVALAVGSLWLLAACSGGSHQIEIGPTPPKATSGTFAGPLCAAGNACTCRDGEGDGGAGVPEQAGYKRFEIRMSSSQALWAKVAGSVMYKDAERPDACFYVDLPVGDTPIELRASDPNGVSAQWSIKELGAQTKSWYDTLDFNCGNPGVCSFDDLDLRKTELKDPKHDRCGSVRIKGLSWDTGRAPDALHPGELLVRATLNVYKFVPTRPHGADCSKKQDDEHAEDNPIK